MALKSFQLLLIAGSLALLPLSAQTQDRIVQRIDTRDTVRLTGNTHPLARPEFDRGAVPPGQRMDRMVLVLAPDARQAELDELVAEQSNPASPLHQRWITPQEFGARFGVSASDLDQIQAWLTGQGFQIDEVPAGLRSVVFSGTAAQVAAAFHTEVHSYLINGVAHFANTADPEIPRALAGVVAGVASLHDFLSQPALASLEAVSPSYTTGGSHYITPADFATVYDLNPLYSNSVDGTGTSIAVVARSNINLSDVTSFRTSMGLPVNNPTIILNGANPGILSGGEQTEATLDVEWAGALAKKAAVKMVVSPSGASDGIVLSAQYIVNHNTAPVMTTSFGSCEAANGTAGTQFWNSLWQQAAAEGITSFVASGDSGAAGCDSGSESTATGGKGVNALGSSAYNVAVGGTQFNDTANPSAYWSSSNSSTTLGSALSYIPELVWNTSGSVSGGSGLWSGGGGTSIVTAKPSWQTGTGVPSGSYRAVPDVSVSASTHDSYLIQMNGGLYAVGGTSASSPSWASLMALVVQHTAASQGNANPKLYGLFRLQSSGGAAVFHDIASGNNSVPGVIGFTAGPGYDQATGIGSPDMFLLVQHWNDTSGPSLNLNLTSATASVGTGSSVQVNLATTVGGGFSGAVTFSVAGLPAGLTASFAPSTVSAPGAGSSTLTLTAASSLAAGVYSLTVKATGGGIVQSSTLAVTVTAPSFTLSASPASATIQQGGSQQVTLTIAVSGGFNSAVTFSATGLPAGVTAAFSHTSLTGAGSTILTLTAAASAAIVNQATVAVTAVGGGASSQVPIALTIQPGLSLSAAPTVLSVPQTGTAQLVLTVTPATALATISVSGLPAGVAASASSSTAGSTAVFLSVSNAASTGTKTLTFSVTSGGVTKTAPVSLTVTPLPFTLSAGSPSLTLAPGASGNVTVTVTPNVGFSSAVALSASGLPAGVSAAFSSASVAGVGAHQSILKITAASSAKAGTATVNIMASGGGATLTVPLSLTISGTSSGSSSR